MLEIACSLEADTDNRQFYSHFSRLIQDLVDQNPFLGHLVPQPCASQSSTRSPISTAPRVGNKWIRFFRDSLVIVLWAFAHNLVDLLPTLIRMMSSETIPHIGRTGIAPLLPLW
jgi:hypothetical protein